MNVGVATPPCLMLFTWAMVINHVFAGAMGGHIYFAQCKPECERLLPKQYSPHYSSNQNDYVRCIDKCMENKRWQDEINNDRTWDRQFTGEPPHPYFTTYPKKTYHPINNTPRPTAYHLVPVYHRPTYYPRPVYPRPTYYPRPYYTRPTYTRPSYRPPYTREVTQDPPTYPEPFPSLFPKSTTSTAATNTRIQYRTGKPSQIGCGIQRNFGSRIIGGIAASACEFPWMVVLEVSGFFCGGSILDNRHVLTAAHCLKNVIPGKLGVVPTSSVKVKYGSSRRSQMKTIGVAKLHVNPKYDVSTGDFDVGVVTLAADLEFGACVGPICLPEAGQNPEDMDECVAAGWGETDQSIGRRSAPDTIQKATLPLVSRDVCNTAWSQPSSDNAYKITIDDRKLCAGYYGVGGGRDACRGDSGGPLMCRNGKGPFTVFGITSFGKKCADPQWPGVYTNVAHPQVLEYINRSRKDIV